MPDSWVRIPAVRRILLALLLGSSSLLFAQARKPSRPASSSSSSTLLSVKATGSTRYSSSQIVAASGLQLGQSVSEDDFKVVSQHLGETGAFSNVAYTFQFSPEGMKLELQVTDADATYGLAESVPALAAAREQLAALDAEELGAPPDRYRRIASILDDLPAEQKLERLFQVDLTKASPRALR